MRSPPAVSYLRASPKASPKAPPYEPCLATARRARCDSATCGTAAGRGLCLDDDGSGHSDGEECSLLVGAAKSPKRGGEGRQVRVLVLTAGTWPLSAEPQPSVRAPDALQLDMDRFQAFYHARHKGRRLTWQLALSRVEVCLCFEPPPLGSGHQPCLCAGAQVRAVMGHEAKRTYTLFASVPQTAVLLALNSNATSSASAGGGDEGDSEWADEAELSEATGLASRELASVMASLLRAQILLIHGCGDGSTRSPRGQTANEVEDVVAGGGATVSEEESAFCERGRAHADGAVASSGRECGDAGRERQEAAAEVLSAGGWRARVNVAWRHKNFKVGM